MCGVIPPSMPGMFLLTHPFFVLLGMSVHISLFTGLWSLHKNGSGNLGEPKRIGPRLGYRLYSISELTNTNHQLDISTSTLVP